MFGRLYTQKNSDHFGLKGNYIKLYKYNQRKLKLNQENVI
jgi:hypothetical protein